MFFLAFHCYSIWFYHKEVVTILIKTYKSDDPC